MKRILLAFQFLTIVPVRNTSGIRAGDIAGSSAFFVIVGLFQGVLFLAAAYLSGLVFHDDLAIATALLVLVLSSGGFHLDGLADTADALAAKASGDVETDRQRRLDIMREGATGPIGVIAIVFALAFKYRALRSIAHLPASTYYSSLLLMPVIPKWTMVISMLHASPARKEGLGRIFIEGTGIREAVMSTCMLAALLALPEMFLGGLIQAHKPMFYGGLLLALYGLCRLLVHLFNNRFGGLTGDTFGAISEVSEVFFLLMVILWSLHFI